MSARTLLIVTLLVLLAGLAIAPAVCFESDMKEYWIPWQHATAGLKPWAAYDVPNCNYPPVVLYLMSLTEAVRSTIGVGSSSRGNWLLLKVPNLLAIAAGTVVLYRATRRSLGERRAAALGAAWALSPNLFVNAALWGQWDAILSLEILLAVIAFARGRYGWAGVWAGVAIATKVQAIFALPILGIGFLFVPGAGRADAVRTNVRATILATIGGVLAIALCCLAFAAAGRMGGVVGVFTASVDTFPRRSMDAWNPWALANGIDVRFRHMTGLVANDDGRAVLPGGALRAFTFKRLGMLMFAAYVLAMLATIARRRRVADVVVGVPLCGLAMFMLCTQMHERYGGPPAALMTLWLLYARPWRWQFFYWTASAALNQLGPMYHKGYLHVAPVRAAYEMLGAGFSLTNTLMFVWLSWLFFRRGAGAHADPVRAAVAAHRDPRAPSD